MPPVRRRKSPASKERGEANGPSSKPPASDEKLPPTQFKNVSRAKALASVLSVLVALLALSQPLLKKVVISIVNDSGDFPAVDFMHATAVAYRFRHTAQTQGFAQRLVSIVITALGGTTLVAWLLGQPCGWLCDNYTLPTYFICWAALEYSPYDAVYRALSGSPVLNFIMGLLDDITWGVAITSFGMEKSISAAHPGPRGSMVAALLCGTLAGCGGGVVQQAFGLLQSDWSFQTPASLRRCSFAIQASFFCALLSYVLRDPLGELQALGIGSPQVPSEVMYIAVCVMCSAATVRDTLSRALAP